MPDNGPITPLAAIAGICGLREAEVAELVREGILPRPEIPGQHDVPACLAAYIAHQRAVTTPKLLRVGELAKEFGVGTTAIVIMVRNGMPKAARGKYDRVACWRWRLERAQAGSSGDNSDLQEERRLLLIEQRRRARIEADAAERIYVLREDVEVGWRQLVAVFRSELLALAGRLAGEVAHVSAPAQARKILDGEARRILDRLRQELSALTARLRGSGS